jgi:hypothetical protein
MTRDDAIYLISESLRERSGRSWSVTGGRGTARSWIIISAAPERRNYLGAMCEADREELGRLLGLRRPAEHHGETVPATYYREYVARAAGLEPPCYGTQYWD